MQAANDLDLATNDLGPLAWVLDELRKSLESASSALRRFVRDAALARGQDMASIDEGQLRIARQHMHQAVGALEMVGLGAPAHMLRCMEAAAQKFVERPELCTEAASGKVERAGFALTEYLEALLLGKPVSPLSLFPQYKDVQELAGADRVHPADLWLIDWRWVDAPTPDAPALAYDVQLRSVMDHAVLKIVKTADPQAARDLIAPCLGLAAAHDARQPRMFWKAAAGYFESLSLSLLPPDIYVKRAASRILLQYATLAKGDPAVSDRLAQDLVFFCSQAVPAPGSAPVLEAVRRAYALERFPAVDYSTSPFGRFDPVLLSQARKRIVAAKETWSALSGGDANKLKGVGEQFLLVTDSLVKLYPPSGVLASALTSSIDTVVRSGRPPSTELAMEVATAILYLEAAFQDLDPTDSKLEARTHRLAERLDRVRSGGSPEALEPWMEELYRRVSDRQTMGSVVGELHGTMGELEKLLDQFFRNPADKAPLTDAPGHLSQMRGVLSVLGLDQAALAVQRMREQVEEIIITEIDEERARAAGTFDKLGNNLGALGFLIDMLNYQPALAKKLFVYDDNLGELRPLMGRASTPVALGADAAEPEVAATPAVQTAPAPSAPAGALEIDFGDMAPAPAPAAPAPVAPAPAPAAAPVAAPAPAPVSAADDEDAELLDIFLEEAREVVQNGLAAVAALAGSPSDMSELTTLRRAFHTLKGSSRMVGLNEFGEAAWSMEQVMNTWLADQKPASDDLRTLANDMLNGFGRWADDIAAKADGAWKSAMFRAPADAMRTEQRLVPLVLPSAAAPAAQPEPVVEAPAEVGGEVSFELPQDEPAQAEATAEAPAQPEPGVAQPALDPDATMFFNPALAFPQPPAAEPAPAPAPAAPELPAALEALSLDLPDTPADEPLTFDTTQVIRAEPAPAAELPADELPPEFAMEFDLDEAPQAPAQVPQPVEIEGIDFGSLSALGAEAPQAEAPAQAAAAPTEEIVSLAAFTPEPIAVLPAAVPEPQPQGEVEAEGADAVRDEQVKVIGSLRIGIPLYNVYLNEADEWSRRLANEVGEWAFEMNERIPDSTVGWAHALAGSSATVGFHTLSDIARALESALEHTQGLAYATPQHAQAFTQAAEEIRRLLHQFAAGFLKDPDPYVVDALLALRELDIPPRAEQPDSGLDDFETSLPASSQQPAELPFQPFVLHAPEPEREPEPEMQAGPAPVAAFAEPAAEPVPEPVAGITPEPPPEPVVAAAIAPVAQPVAQQPVVAVPQQPAAQQAGASVSGEDDLDVVDVIDADLFPIFEEEAIELMPALGGALRQWSSRADDTGARDEALRVLHTLKGSARLAGALRLGELAHRLESEIEYLGSEGVNRADIEELLHRFDTMQARFDVLRGVATAEEADAIAAAAPVAVPVAEAQAPQAQEAPAAAAPQAAPAGRNALAMPSTMAVTSARQASNQAVRVRSHLLDRLVNQAGEVMITRSRLEEELRQLRGSLSDLTGNLDRLRAQLREIEVQAESQMQSRMAQSKESAAGFDPLEFDRFTRVQELTRFMAESVNDVATVQRNIQRVVEATEDDLIAQARQTRELQRDLLRTRMVEFEGISDRLYRVVRLAAKESGKQVKLDIIGGSIEMDRGVLDRMTPAFEHLLRNCVAHGVETPAERTAAGKDAAGTIVIGLHHEGNDVSVEFKDDGAGLNVARIREKALQQGLITADQQLSDAEAANLIFLPGFSTAAQVTELAGRGIGMDVVRAEVSALGGRIETTTAPGAGTSFKLVLPLTTAVTQVVMIRSGTLSIGVPANLIELVRRTPAKDVQQAYNAGTYEFAGEQLPFFWSGALLQSSSHSTEPQGKTLPVVIFRSAAQRVAVHVDEVLGNQEVVVKNLGPQLSRLPGLAGMTVLASGAVVLIYNPVALAQVFGDQARRLSADKAQPDMLENASASVPAMPVMPVAPAIPLVLVVDDSITVRRVTQRLLQREGYRVALAADGLQALERLAEERPAVVLSDIEMPRMDGFDLARNIRGDTRLKELPIVMITSRIAEKHREHAKELGVNHYLGKPYSEEELLSLVKHYCTAAVAATV